MEEFKIGKSITVSPNQKFNELNEDPETGCKIVTMPGMVLYTINGVYPIRQYQHTVALCRVKMIRIKANSKGEVYTAVYFDYIETKNSLMDAWDQVFSLDGTNSSGIDKYEDSKEAFIPGAGPAPNYHPGKDSMYRRSVESDEIKNRRRSDRESGFRSRSDETEQVNTSAFSEDFWKNMFR